LVQVIEDVRTFAGGTVTVSFYAKAATSTLAAPAKIAVELSQSFGTGGSPSADVNTYAGQATLSTSWQRYSLTVALPSISGKTIGTAANTSSLKLNLWTSAGTTFNSRTGSLGIQSNTFDIWGVQVERGGYATSFEERPLQQEIALCQRYFCKTFGINVAPASAAGQEGALFAGRSYAASTTVYVVNWQYPANMRIAPIVTTFNPSAAGSGWFDEGGTSVAATAGNIATNGAIIYNSANCVINRNAGIHATANAEF
jgi:hypothetical protein